MLDPQRVLTQDSLAHLLELMETEFVIELCNELWWQVDHEWCGPKATFVVRVST